MAETPASAWRMERDDDGIIWLTADKPGTSTNVLSSVVLRELDALLDRISSPPRGIVVISAKKSGFIAGADIKAFSGITSAESGYRLIHAGQQVFDRLEALPCPTVAAIHGFALGGGLELALACRYRVAVADERLSLSFPEVQLGIHPGFGGTVRSVRLIGVRAAMQMMLTGKPVRAQKALQLGLVDRLVPESELRAAARQLILAPPPPHRPSLIERALSWPLVRSLVQRSLVGQVAQKVRREHYPAPYAIIDLWVRYGARGAVAFEAEARSIAQLFTTETARNLIRVFLLQERLKSLGGKASAPLQRVHVIGAGVMGGDIAAWCALRGFEVSLQDREMKFVEPALARAHKLFDSKLKTPDRIEPACKRLVADVEGAGIASSQLAIEAIHENPEAKQAVYRALEPKLADDALIATNTSSIPLDQLRGAFKEPRRFLGLHFFNPVAQMPLVEVVRHDTLDPSLEKRAWAWVKAIGKLPLPVLGTPGFLVNRILMPYLLEAVRCHAEGIPDPVIDRAAKHFGMPMGPIELADTVGLDVALSVGRELGPFLQLELPSGIADKVEAGRRGKKDGQGFYVWKDGKPEKPKVDPNYRVPADLEDRLILPMLNEAVACLHAGVVADADLLDAGVIFGTGFAPFRGGPIQYVRATGAGVLREKLEALAQTHGTRFAPKQGWFNPALAKPA